MTATHTGKANRRYCYYASAATRIPAGDLDRLVQDAIGQALGSPASLAAALPSFDLLSPMVIAAAAALANELENDGGSVGRIVGELVDRVEVTDAGVTTTLRLASIGLEGETGTIVTPASIGRGKMRLTLVVPGQVAAKPDGSLVAAVAQARGWMADLTSGRHRSLDQLAAASHVTPGYVRQLIGAAFLAPDLVTRIVEGRQPSWLTKARLTAMLPLPKDWSAQRALFERQN